MLLLALRGSADLDLITAKEVLKGTESSAANRAGLSALQMQAVTTASIRLLLERIDWAKVVLANRIAEDADGALPDWRSLSPDRLREISIPELVASIGQQEVLDAATGTVDFHLHLNRLAGLAEVGWFAAAMMRESNGEGIKKINAAVDRYQREATRDGLPIDVRAFCQSLDTANSIRRAMKSAGSKPDDAKPSVSATTAGGGQRSTTKVKSATQRSAESGRSVYAGGHCVFYNFGDTCNYR